LSLRACQRQAWQSRRERDCFVAHAPRNDIPLLSLRAKRGNPGERDREMFHPRVLIVGLIVLFLSLILLSGCDRQERLLLTSGQEENLVLMEAEGIVLSRWSDEGEKIWELKAVSGVQTLREITLSQVSIFLYEEGRVTSEGEAEEVRVDNQFSDLLLRGNVRVASYAEGDELFTSELQWSNRERKLWTEEEVILKKGRLVTRGRGLVADADLDTIVIKEDVTTYFENTGGKEWENYSIPH